MPDIDLDLTREVPKLFVLIAGMGAMGGYMMSLAAIFLAMGQTLLAGCWLAIGHTES